MYFALYVRICLNCLFLWSSFIPLSTLVPASVRLVRTWDLAAAAADSPESFDRGRERERQRKRETELERGRERGVKLFGGTLWWTINDVGIYVLQPFDIS